MSESLGSTLNSTLRSSKEELKDIEVSIFIETILQRKNNEEEQDLFDPNFRYNFFDQEKVSTSAIKISNEGSNEGWDLSRVGELPPPSPNPTDTESAGLNEKLGSARGGAVEEDADAMAQEDLRPVLCKFSKKHKIKGDARMDWALSLDQQPVLSVWVADRAEGGKATAVFPGPGTSKRNSLKEGEDPPQPVGRNFMKWWPLDLSPLLAGETEVWLQYGSQEPSDNQDSDARVEGLVPGMTYLRLGVVASEAVLTVNETEELNPLTITLTKLKDLPGVRAPKNPLPTKLKNLQETFLLNETKSTTFEPLEQFCEPPYLTYSLFRQGEQPRLVFTPQASSGGCGPHLKLNHTASFLTGYLDTHLVHEVLLSKPLVVEVHDRDPKPSAIEQAKKIASWEKLLVGGYPITEDGSCKSSVLRTSVPNSVPTTARKSARPSATAVGDDGLGEFEDGSLVPGDEIEYTKPMGIFEVDALIWDERLARLRDAGNHVTHGVASFRLDGMLSTAKQLSKAFAKNKALPLENGGIDDDAIVLKLKGEVTQTKRRIQPKGAGEEWALSEGERLVRKPGHYLDTMTSLNLRASIHRPLVTLQESNAEWTGPSTAILRPFARAVFIFSYQDTDELQRIISAVDKVNTEALPTITGSLRSYKLTEEEAKAADQGDLDIVCGFQIIDDDCRMIVIEGLGDGGLADVVYNVPRLKANDHSTKILSNLDIRFKERFYTEFSVDLKKIHLRDPLPLLAKNPEIYNRAKVSELCFNCLQKLAEMRESKRLAELQIHNLFPTEAMLTQVESKYGESITMADIHGVKVAEKMKKTGTPSVEEENIDDETLTQSTSMQTTNTKSKLKGPTDITNEMFEQHLKTRETRDFMRERRKQNQEAKKTYQEARKRREEEIAMAYAEGPVHVYGGQTLQCVAVEKSRLRSRLVRDPKGTYTYSNDFLSHQFSMADEDNMSRDAAKTGKEKWMTQRGFIYPAPRKPTEYNVHPKKPDETRLDILKERWVENDNVAKPVERNKMVNDGRPDFHVKSSKGEGVFGGLGKPVYTRDYDSSKLGDYSKLPRGRMILTRDKDFFKSVHLCGDGLQKTLDEAKIREEELWKSKVVVDNVDFKVGRLKVKDKPAQMDRAKDILDGPVLKKSLHIVRNAKLPSGKKTLLEAPPISINDDAYEDPKDFTADLRADNPEEYIATDVTTGKKIPFVRHIHKNTFKEKSKTSTSIRKHPPLSHADTTGPRWSAYRK